MRLLRRESFREFEAMSVYNMSGVPTQVWLRFNEFRFSARVSKSMIESFNNVRQRLFTVTCRIYHEQD